MDDNPDLFTTHQAAKIFGVKPITVIRWIKKGVIPCMSTVGGHRRIKREDLKRLAEKNNVSWVEEV